LAFQEAARRLQRRRQRRKERLEAEQRRKRLQAQAKAQAKAQQETEDGANEEDPYDIMVNDHGTRAHRKRTKKNSGADQHK